MEFPVIARIPALDPPTTSHRHRRSHSSEAKSTKTVMSYGRLIGASLSMKLLAGMGIFLFVGAVGPYIYFKVVDKSPSDTGQALEQAWQPPLPAPTADLAPAWEPPSAQPTPFPEIQPAIADLPAEKIRAQCVPHWRGVRPGLAMSKTEAEFSPWPNPAHPVLAKDDAPGRTIPIRPTAGNTPPTDKPDTNTFRQEQL